MKSRKRLDKKRALLLKSKINKQVKAENDLIDIWLYTLNEWNEKQADHYLDELNDKIQKLIDNPYLGTNCEYVRKGYRRLAVFHHKVYYYLTDDSIEVVRVLHERMDEERNL